MNEDLSFVFISVAYPVAYPVYQPYPVHYYAGPAVPYYGGYGGNLCPPWACPFIVKAPFINYVVGLVQIFHNHAKGEDWFSWSSFEVCIDNDMA